MNSAGSFPGNPGHRSTEQSGVGSRSWSHLQSWTSFMALLSPPARKIRTLPDFWGDPLLRESDSFKLPEAFLKHLTNTYRTALPSQWQCLLRTTPPHTLFLLLSLLPLSSPQPALTTQSVAHAEEPLKLASVHSVGFTIPIGSGAGTLKRGFTTYTTSVSSTSCWVLSSPFLEKQLCKQTLKTKHIHSCAEGDHSAGRSHPRQNRHLLRVDHSFFDFLTLKYSRYS